MIQKEVGQRIVTLRKRSGYTQKELADRLMVTCKAISRWEQGHGLPELSILFSLCKEFNITIETLFDGILFERYISRSDCHLTRSDTMQNKLKDSRTEALRILPNYHGIRIKHETKGPGIISSSEGEELCVGDNTFWWSVQYDSGLKGRIPLPDLMAIGIIVPERETDFDLVTKSSAAFRLLSFFQQMSVLTDHCQ